MKFIRGDLLNTGVLTCNLNLNQIIPRCFCNFMFMLICSHLQSNIKCRQLIQWCVLDRGAKQEGIGGVATLPEFWMGGGVEHPLIFRKILLGEVGSP